MTQTKENLINTKSFYLKKLEGILEGRADAPDMPLLNLPNLNRKIWGIHRKKLTVIGARTSNCKSAFAMNIAFDIAKQGKKVLFLSLEMAPEDIYERMFCMAKRVNNFEILCGGYAKDLELKTRFADFKKEITGYPIIITDSIGRTWQQIEDLVKISEPKPDLVVIDHIQEIFGEKKTKKETIDDYLIQLREMAIRNNFALVICSQINRVSQESTNKEPQLHQLKDSGGIEEKADIVILLHYYSKYNVKKSENDFKLEVAKNRNGRTGYFEMLYRPEYYLFEDKPVEEKKKEERVDWE